MIKVTKTAWPCEHCGKGMKQRTNAKVTIHRDGIDHIVTLCPKCAKDLHTRLGTWLHEHGRKVVVRDR